MYSGFRPQLTAVGKIERDDNHRGEKRLTEDVNHPVSCDNFLDITINSADQSHRRHRRKQYGRLD